MSASDDIKQELADRFDGTAASNWKRTSKKKIGNTQFRVFEHPATKSHDAYKILAAYDGDSMFDISDVIYFHFFDAEACGGDYEEPDVMAICPKKYWDETKAIWDQHCSFVLTYFGVDLEIYEESENQISLYDVPKEEVREAMLKAGFVEFDMSRAGRGG